MAIPVACGKCSSRFQAPDAAAGKTLACPKCATPIKVPGGQLVTQAARSPIAQQKPVETRSQAVVATVECAFCSETIIATAKKCKHCGETLDPAMRAAEEVRRSVVQSATIVNVTQQVNQQVIVPAETFDKDANPFLSAFGNILWIILGGWVLFLEYLFAGLLLCITVIGIPFGIQCIKLAMLALMPFGKRVRNTQSSVSSLTTIMNILWLFPGFIIALTHVLSAIVCGITIILLPFAKQHMKLAALALQPFGKEIR